MIFTFILNRSSSILGFSCTAALTTTMLCLGVVFGVFFADRWDFTCTERPRVMMPGFFGESVNQSRTLNQLKRRANKLTNNTSDRPVDGVRNVRQVDIAANAVAGRCVGARRSALLTLLRVVTVPRTFGHRFASFQFRIFRTPRLGGVGLRTLFGAHNTCKTTVRARCTRIITWRTTWIYRRNITSRKIDRSVN